MHKDRSSELVYQSMRTGPVDQQERYPGGRRQVKDNKSNSLVCSI